MEHTWANWQLGTKTSWTKVTCPIDPQISVDDNGLSHWALMYFVTQHYHNTCWLITRCPPHWTQRASKQWSPVQMRAPVNGVWVKSKGSWEEEKTRNLVWILQFASCGVLVDWPHFCQEQKEMTFIHYLEHQNRTRKIYHKNSVNAPGRWCLTWPYQSH